MSRVRFRKDTIFRIYLAVFCLLFAGASLFVISSQAQFHKRQMEDFQRRLDSLRSELSEVRSSSVVEDAPLVSVEETKKKEDMFWIEGTGNNRKWWYMDVVFVDGERFRYFLHLPPRRSDLIGLHRRLSHDALVHYRDPVMVDDDFGI